MKQFAVLFLGVMWLGLPPADAATTSLIDFGAVWKYLDDGSDQGTAWIDPDFDDSGWASGPAQLGYGENDEATVISFGDNAGDKHITYYFRHAFTVNNPGQVVTLSLNVRRDDGVIVYLNGTEVFRDNMPDGPVDYLTFSLRSAPDDGNNLIPGVVDPALLVAGENVMAAEIHQQSPSSSDVSFDLELVGSDENNPPSVAVVSPGNNSLFTAPTDILISASASDSDGFIDRVEFFRDGIRLGEDSTEPYEFNWQNVALGTYALTARAVDNLGAEAISVPVNVIVDQSSFPSIASVFPVPGAVGELTSISVTFSEAVTGVDASDLRVNGRPALGVTGSLAAYTFEVNPPGEGTVYVAWRGDPGIADLENPPRAFDPFQAGAQWQYTLSDNVAPTVVARSPAPGATLPELRRVRVTFSEAVSGVDAADLRVNGLAATDVDGAGAGPYRFDLPPLSPGTVTFSWAGGHGITDQAAARNAFAGGGWTYTLDTNLVVEGQVVINEIMFNPASARIDEEYLELLNLGTEPVNLTGWRLTRGVDFTFPATSLPAGGYLVVAADPARFQSKYPAVANVVGGWDGRLSNRSEEVELEDARGDRVDLVAYADGGDYAIRTDVGGGSLDWVSQADGLGRSLELRNPVLENDTGQNWAPSEIVDGTPGQPNSATLGDIPPMILETSHFPPVPRSDNEITVTARIIDESTSGLTVRLWSRDITGGGSPTFASRTMVDDGTGNDGAAGDGVYGAVLGPRPDGTLIEFYVEARDAGGLSRTWPAPVQSGGSFAQSANALLQVDNEISDGGQPFYRFVMTVGDRDELINQTDRVLRNLTFITTEGDRTLIRYNCDVRRRGASSFRRNPPTMRLGIPTDRLWHGKSSLNLNSDRTHGQVLGGAVSLRAGLPAGNAFAVQLRINSVNEASSGFPQFGSYAHVERIDGEWAEDHFPLDGGGNVYVKRRPECGLEYRGEDPSAYISCDYRKQSNTGDNDWSDLARKLFAMDPDTTPDNEYVQAIRRNINVELWMRYFAVLVLMDYNETALATGADDDYDLYRGVIDPRFMVVPHDFDSIFGTTGNSANDIFIADRIPNVSRFLHHPEFEPLYFEEHRRQFSGLFATNSLFPLMDQVLGDWVPETTLNDMKSDALARRNYVLGALPPAPVVVRATVSGEPDSPTFLDTATLVVGGEDITSYRYRLNGGPFGSERTVSTPITLTGLADGTYTVFVIGRNSSGTWQAESEATASATWAVLSDLRRVVFHEVLALNDGAVDHFGTFPDMVELFNPSGSTVDLSGYRLTDNLDNPDKFTFPAGTSLGSGGYLVLWANDPDGTPGLHLGFGLNQRGESLFLLGPASQGDRVLDQRTFGLQLPDRGVGLLANGQWGLTLPTAGGANVAAAVAHGDGLRINEWLANPQAPFTEDFVEIFNPASQPVALGGWFLTDQPVGDPFRHRMVPLSFIAARGYLALVADGNAGAGADHLNFQLAQRGGEIALLDPTGRLVDGVIYDLQDAGVSEGRVPDGGPRILRLPQPTPQAGNPAPPEPVPPQLVNLVPFSQTWRYEASNTDLQTAWREVGFDDSGWPQGQALIGFENGDIPLEPIRTLLERVNGRVTTYYRTTFQFDASQNYSGVELRHIIDDGAVFYLNGTEVGRHNLPGGTIDFQTTADTVVEAPLGGPIDIPLALLQDGSNLLAAELHQNNNNSADQLFGVQLDAVIITNNPALTGVVLNEVMANNQTFTNSDGTITDWVELYNPSNASVDLFDMSLTDDLTNPRRWVFPPGSAIGPGEYLIVHFDTARPASTNDTGFLNTGFGLAASGEAVYLFNRPDVGGGLLDGIPFGIQAPDFSIGRIPDGGESWRLTQVTRQGRNLSAALGDPSRLKINEWMADPFSGDDWFELYNPNAQPVALGGLHLTDDLNDRLKHRIADRSYISAGLVGFQQFRADNNLSAGADHVNFALSADGDSVGIADEVGRLIHGVTFGPQVEGVSEGSLPDGAANVVFFPETPTPGESNFLPIPGIVINEVLAHSDPPLEDAIELRNLTASPVDLSGWFLSDSRAFLEKFQVPAGTVIPAGGYLVFYEQQFNPIPGDPESFALSSARGDQVFLSEYVGGLTPTGFRRQVSFGPTANGVSLGRHVTSALDGSREEFVAMTRRTFGADDADTVEEFRTGTGAANSGPLVGPVVVSEIMYHPPDIGGTNDNVLEEYVELHNLSGTTAFLYDPAHPANGWRLEGAVTFEFSSPRTIPAGGFLLVVSFDPDNDPVQRAAFEAAYGLAPGVAMAGPYQGKLDNSGENVELFKPDPPQTEPGPDFGLVPMVLVERIDYTDNPPWPSTPDGFGDSLTRVNVSAFANDVANWTAAAPSPGPQGVPEDSDRDGMPDTWESMFGLNPNDPTDAELDGDGDGATNREEFRAGTDPTDPNSVLRLTLLGTEPVTLQFVAEPDIFYSLEFRDRLAPATSWQVLTNVSPSSLRRVISPVDNAAGSQRFYQLRVP